MNNYYVFEIESLVQTFSVVDAGKEVRFNYTSKDNGKLFAGIQEGDYILGYYNKPMDKIKILFEAVKVNDEGTLTLNKRLEVGCGADIDRDILDSLKSNALVSITPIQFQKIYNEMINKQLHEVKMIGSDEENVVLEGTIANLTLPRNRIIFGAPGTGKSYTINKEKDQLLSNGGSYERVTFHPDYSYANFVGTYKPVPKGESITYEYVPGPFMRILVNALKNAQSENHKPYLLIIEEINRANVAAVFGDVFQLLDRDENNVSEYPIHTSEDMRRYLAKNFVENFLKLDLSEQKAAMEKFREISIPSNMFIWATMNSADQGVYPMDTAFKRRWDFTYLGVDDEETVEGIKGKYVVLGSGQYCRRIEWNQLRQAINNELLGFKVNEDKLLGAYFIKINKITNGDEIDSEKFIEIFKNKVIMYLFDDAAKHRRSDMFGQCEDKNKKIYSGICKEFDEKGIYIFSNILTAPFPKDEYKGGAEE